MTSYLESLRNKISRAAGESDYDYYFRTLKIEKDKAQKLVDADEAKLQKLQRDRENLDAEALAELEEHETRAANLKSHATKLSSTYAQRYKQTADSTSSAAEKTVAQIKSTLKGWGEAVSSYPHDVAESFYAAKDHVASAGKSAKEKVGEKAGEAAEEGEAFFDKIKNALFDFSGQAEDKVDEAKESVSSGARQAKKKGKEYGEKASETASSYGEATGDTLNYAKEQGQRTASQAGQKLRDGAAYTRQEAADWYDWTVHQIWRPLANQRMYTPEDWNSVVQGSEFRKYLKSKKLDYEQWKNHLSNSRVLDPEYWKDYVDEYTKSPSTLSKYWKEAKENYGPSSWNAEWVNDLPSDLKETFDQMSGRTKSQEWGRWASQYMPDTLSQQMGLRPSRFERSYQQLQHRGQEYLEHLGPAPVSGLFAALFSLYFLYMVARTFRLRKKLNIWLGDGTMELVTALRTDTDVKSTTAAYEKFNPLLRALAAQQWFTSYVPLSILLLALMEINQTVKALIPLAYVSLAAAVMMYTDFGLISDNGVGVGRAPGILLTWITLGVAAFGGLFCIWA